VRDEMIEHSAQINFLKRPLAVLTSLVLLQSALFYSTYWSMIEIWWRSETFAHAFFIFPISGYLIWRRRRSLNTVDMQNDWRALIFLAGLSFLWLIAFAVDVVVVKQFAVVMMLPVLVWLCLGLRMVAALTFPLLFLLFAVPFGEFLVYPLMKFTATFTVHAIRMVGIPVFWEGMYFSLPSGSWSVVEACSGFRYILASLTLGALYAYLSYHNVWRRAAFMLLALVVPIIANGLRAFMIVMIGHFSGMELAVGVDHLIYGWVWFGIVMFAMFWVGSFWQDKKSELENINSASPTISEIEVFGKSRAVGWVASCAIIILALPVWLALTQSSINNQIVTLQLPSDVATWQFVEQGELTKWAPVYQGATQELQAIYRSDNERVGLHVAYFGNQKQGAELVNRGHRLRRAKEKYWKESYRLTRTETISDTEIGLLEVQIKSPEQSLLVWQWKYFIGVRTSNDFYLKALEAWATLTGKPRHGAAIIVYAEYQDGIKGDRERAAKQLKAFVTEMMTGLEHQFEI